MMFQAFKGLQRVGVWVLRREKTGQGEDSIIDRWTSVAEQLVGLILEHSSLTVPL